MTIKNEIRVEAGHTVGKTKLASGIVNHFFDCFPSIIYTFAPTFPQIHDLLMKELKTDRRNGGLPGKINDMEIKLSDTRFIKGRATDNSNDAGTERIQGQHNEYLMFVVDEAEGVKPFVFDAIKSMASGGIAIVLYLANPRTRTSQFYRIRTKPEVQNFRISCLYHPNVVFDKDVIPGAVRRQYVNTMAADHCEVVDEHDEDDHTFTLDWDVPTSTGVIPAGTILKPDSTFLFRVAGIPPKNITDRTLITLGRYEAAVNRRVSSTAAQHEIRIGVDAARFGKDYGTIYIRRGMQVWRQAQVRQQRTTDYVAVIKDALQEFAKEGVQDVQIRVDGGGGFGGGVIDQLQREDALHRLFDRFELVEVNFNAAPHDETSFADIITEAYSETAESLKGLSIIDPPSELEIDLTARRFKYVNRSGRQVKALESKEEFRREYRRSPDDGDGFVLAVAPDFIFEKERAHNPGSYSYSMFSG